MTVVFDTNIWVSLAINQQLDLISALHKQGTTIAGCKNLLHELVIVFSRSKFERYFPKAYLDGFVKLYQLTTTNFELLDIPKVVADEKDDYLFALCKISGANYFITGDKLLLAVNQYYNTSVITLADFKHVLTQY